jgi:hypothetical protein
MATWKRPSGTTIELRDDEASEKFARDSGWEKVTAKPKAKAKPKSKAK